MVVLMTMKLGIKEYFTTIINVKKCCFDKQQQQIASVNTLQWGQLHAYNWVMLAFWTMKLTTHMK